ncbi:hypothetical protein [Thalassotalea crassostreae]|nr:hypothetical protein [Thalassotalea crassostreae]
MKFLKPSLIGLSVTLALGLSGCKNDNLATTEVVQAQQQAGTLTFRAKC